MPGEKREECGWRQVVVLPFAGSGKIPWLRLLMTDDLGDSWLPSWMEEEEPVVVLGEECREAGLAVPWRPWRRWWSASLCSFRGSQRGTLSSWAVLDKSIRTCKEEGRRGFEGMALGDLASDWSVVSVAHGLPHPGSRWRSPYRSPTHSLPGFSSSTKHHTQVKGLIPTLHWFSSDHSRYSSQKSCAD